MSPYEQLSVIKQHQFSHILLCFNSPCWSRLYAHSLTREFVRYLTKKHTVFRVIIKVTEKLVISRRTNI